MIIVITVVTIIIFAVFILSFVCRFQFPVPKNIFTIRLASVIMSKLSPIIRANQFMTIGKNYFLP